MQPQPGASAATARPTPTPSRCGPCRDGGGWRLDGIARYVHAAHNADLLLVVAADSGDERRTISWWPGPHQDCRADAGGDWTSPGASPRCASTASACPAEDEVPGGQAVLERCLARGHGPAVGRIGWRRRGPLRRDGGLRQEARAVRPDDRELPGHQAPIGQPARSSSRRCGSPPSTPPSLSVTDSTTPPEAVATAGAYVDDAFAHLCGEALQLHGGHRVHVGARRPSVRRAGPR